MSRVIITASVRRLDRMMHAVYVWIAAHLTKNPFAHQMAQHTITDVCLKEKFVYFDKTLPCNILAAVKVSTVVFESVKK